MHIFIHSCFVTTEWSSFIKLFLKTLKLITGKSNTDYGESAAAAWWMQNASFILGKSLKIFDQLNYLAFKQDKFPLELFFFNMLLLAKSFFFCFNKHEPTGH